jgi:mRNA interferase MazF
MKQGDVYWYTFRAPDKRRPVLVLTRNSAIPYLSGITVAQITTTIRGMASEVVLTPGADGMFADCAVNADNIQTIQKSQFGELITELSPERMREVRLEIEFALGFDALVRH